jgi:hypothetical protein
VDAVQVKAQLLAVMLLALGTPGAVGAWESVAVPPDELPLDPGLHPPPSQLQIDNINSAVINNAEYGHVCWAGFISSSSWLCPARKIEYLINTALQAERIRISKIQTKGSRKNYFSTYPSRLRAILARSSVSKSSK